MGLSLALELTRAGYRVTVFDEAPELGGLASAWSIGDVTWDRHYHVTLASDAHTRAFLAELGLEAEIQWVVTRTGFYDGQALVSISSTPELLRLPGLNLVDKARLGATIWHGSRVRDWARLEEIPVVDWLTQWSGRRTVERLWRPLLRAKLGDDYEECSAAFIWATIQRLYAARRSGLKREMFGYVPGGYARVMARAHEILSGRGCVFRLGRRVTSIERMTGGLQVGSEDSQSPEAADVEVFDRVVVTAPPPVAARLCPQLGARERQAMARVGYHGIVCASMLLERPLADYYLTYITDTSLPFTAVVEMTAFVDAAELGGRHLVYLPKYVTEDDPFFQVSDDQVQDRFLRGIETMYPAFDRGQVLDFRVSRVRRVFATPVLGYSQHVPPVTTSVPGLYCVNSAQIVNGTLNVNETLGQATAVLPAVLADAANEVQAVPPGVATVA